MSTDNPHSASAQYDGDDSPGVESEIRTREVTQKFGHGSRPSGRSPRHCPRLYPATDRASRHRVRLALCDEVHGEVGHHDLGLTGEEMRQAFVGRIYRGKGPRDVTMHDELPELAHLATTRQFDLVSEQRHDTRHDHVVCRRRQRL